jgi:hypothetical protein
MAKSSSKAPGIIAAIAAITAGAAAVFFSKKENRDMARAELGKAAVKARKLRKVVRQEAPKVAKKVKASGQKLAAQAVKAANKATAPKKVSKAKSARPKAKAKRKAAKK